MEKKYYTVAEVAARIGVSKQAVYQQLNKRFKRYSILVDGRRMLKADIFNELENQVELKNQSTFNQDSSELNKQNADNEELINTLRAQLAEQKETIERLQKDLDDARADIRHKDDQLEALSARLASITEKTQELLYNSQVLQAQAQKKGFFKRLFAPKENTSK